MSSHQEFLDPSFVVVVVVVAADAAVGPATAALDAWWSLKNLQ